MKREETHCKAVRLFPLVEHRGFVWLTCEMCGQKRCTLSKALQRNRISILEAFQSNNFCNGFYCLTPKDEFHHLQTNYFSWQLLSLLRSHMYKQL